MLETYEIKENEMRGIQRNGQEYEELEAEEYTQIKTSELKAIRETARRGEFWRNSLLIAMIALVFGLVSFAFLVNSQDVEIQQLRKQLIECQSK